MSKIYSHKGVTAELMKVFGYTKSGVSRALNFQRSSIDDRRIRSYAVNTLECYYRL